MQFVNTSSHSTYSAICGGLKPGAVSRPNPRIPSKLQTCLQEIVKACGNDMGIRLSATESELLNKLMDLDEKGVKFDPSSLPGHILKDPTGEKRAFARAAAEQHREMDRLAKRNAASLKREALINGEIEEGRRPVGPATMEGEPVAPSKIKSGFEAIMEENAKIASGKERKTDIGEVLDPIGRHMKRTDGSFQTPDEEVKANAIGRDPVSVKKASNLEDDVARIADTKEPVPQAPRKNKMDDVAADIASKLSTLGPTDREENAEPKTSKASDPVTGIKIQKKEEEVPPPISPFSVFNKKPAKDKGAKKSEKADKASRSKKSK